MTVICRAASLQRAADARPHPARALPSARAPRAAANTQVSVRMSRRSRGGGRGRPPIQMSFSSRGGRGGGFDFGREIEQERQRERASGGGRHGGGGGGGGGASDLLSGKVGRLQGLMSRQREEKGKEQQQRLDAATKRLNDVATSEDASALRKAAEAALPFEEIAVQAAAASDRARLVEDMRLLIKEADAGYEIRDDEIGRHVERLTSALAVSEQFNCLGDGKVATLRARLGDAQKRQKRMEKTRREREEAEVKLRSALASEDVEEMRTAVRFTFIALHCAHRVALWCNPPHSTASSNDWYCLGVHCRCRHSPRTGEARDPVRPSWQRYRHSADTGRPAGTRLCRRRCR